MINNALKLANRNKNTLQNSKNAGCFKCLKVFETQTITEYTDQGETGLCPHCGYDSVIAENGFKVDEAYLRSVKDFLFKD
jgi:NAD-dependent SIR2 family protein deacetylase